MSCSVKAHMLQSHVLNTSQLPAFCIWEYPDDQTHILSRALQVLNLKLPIFGNGSWLLLLLLIQKSWFGPSWLLILSALLVICSGWESAEKSEVFYASGCRPYEVMTVSFGDICSAFPIEFGRRTGAECLAGAESKWNWLWDKAENVVMACISAAHAGGGDREEEKVSTHSRLKKKPRGPRNWRNNN